MRISDWSSDVCSSDLFGGKLLKRIFPGAYRSPFKRCGPQKVNGAYLSRQCSGAAQYFASRSSLCRGAGDSRQGRGLSRRRSEEHTSELQSLMRISYAVFCLKKKNTKYHTMNIE